MGVDDNVFTPENAGRILDDEKCVFSFGEEWVGYDEKLEWNSDFDPEESRRRSSTQSIPFLSK